MLGICDGLHDQRSRTFKAGHTGGQRGTMPALALKLTGERQHLLLSLSMLQLTSIALPLAPFLETGQSLPKALHAKRVGTI